jgi:hypothetical protein
MLVAERAGANFPKKRGKGLHDFGSVQELTVTTPFICG